MCVICHKPKGIKLDEKYWAECFRMNGHGAGLTYVEDNKLIVDKGYFKFEPLYKEIAKHEEKEMIVHFRIASAGSIQSENCHPFFIQGNNFKHMSFSVSHNGTLSWRSTKEASDTRCFVDDILGPQLDMHPWFLDHLAGLTLLERFCGARNKLAIMRYDSKKMESKVYIINPEAGVRDMGCWFSNTSYRLPVTYNNHRNGMMFGEDYWPEDKGFPHDPMNESDWSNYGFHLDKDGRWIPNRLRLDPTRAKEIPPAVSVMPELGGENNGKILGTFPGADAETTEKQRLHRMNSRLEHLTNKEKKIYRRMANDLARETMTWAYAKQTPLPELIENLRETYRYSSLDGAVVIMEDAKLDKFIVDEFKRTGKNPECITSPTVDATSPDSPDEIDDAVAAHADLEKVEQFPSGAPVQQEARAQEFDKT